jgi:tetratricopeptide (TPR) repeat protein
MALDPDDDDEAASTSSVARLRAVPMPWRATSASERDILQPRAGGSAAAVAAASAGVFPQILLREIHGADLTPVSRVVSQEIPATATGRGKYQVLGEIARGGMGAILKGRDTDLGRDLAIKVLLDSHRNDPELLGRFVEEAQIGGQLQHPGIVPVYELGWFSDGRPYFTMKLVKGQTLAALLQARAAPADDQPRFLAIFESVCQTLAYAHARGVIHRDLKPSNVMVGHFGEVQVMDWGLAKVVQAGGAADDRGPGPATAAAVNTQRSGSARHASRAGSVLGTPAYMPPEQARGEIHEVSERADVFALGAMLCEILTGLPPYVAATHAETEHMAAHGDLAAAFTRLAESGGDGVLLDLARRCLAAAPVDRPRDAGEVSRAVTAYLAGVQEKLRSAEMDRARAHATAIEERKRRKVEFRMAAAILVALFAGIAGVAAQWSRAEANLRTSQARLKLASEAIERFYTGASEDVLLKEPQLKALRDKLLNSALEFYKKLQDELLIESGTAPTADLAAAYERVGAVTAEIGSIPAAIDAVEHARGIRSQAAAGQAGNPQAQAALAAVLEQRGGLLADVGRAAEAIDNLQEARSIRVTLARAPGDFDARLRLARTEFAIAKHLGQGMSRLPEAEAAVQRSISLGEEQVSTNPASAPARRVLGEALGLKGIIKHLASHFEEACAAYERAIKIFDDLASEQPDDLPLRDALAKTVANLGNAALRLNRIDEANGSFQRALSIYETLVRDQPNVSKYQADVGYLHLSIAFWLTRMHRTERAAEENQRAVQTFDRLAAEHPTIANFVFRQGQSYTALAENLRELGRLVQALAIANRALEITDRVGRDHRGVVAYQEARANARICNASILRQMGRHGEATQAYLDLVKIYEPIRHNDPVNEYNLACAHACLAALLAGRSREQSGALADSAASHLDRAIAGVRTAVAAGYRRTAAMHEDPDLEPLRKRPDFQLFMMDLEFPEHAFTR